MGRTVLPKKKDRPRCTVCSQTKDWKFELEENYKFILATCLHCNITFYTFKSPYTGKYIIYARLVKRGQQPNGS